MTRYQPTPPRRTRTTVQLLIVAMTAAVILAATACSGEQTPPTPRPQTEDRSPSRTMQAMAQEIAVLQTKAAESTLAPDHRQDALMERPTPAESQPDALTAISTGSDHACGIRSDRELTCWGSNSHGQADPPPGKFTHISSGTESSCALATNGTVACWGIHDRKPVIPPSGTFKNIAPFRENMHCGVKTDGTIACWPDGNHILPQWPDQEYISVGGTCAVPRTGDTICLGREGTYTKKGHYSSLSLYQHVCGIDENQQARCWNADDGQEVLKIPGEYKSLYIGEEKVVCGVHTNGTITCNEPGGRVITPPELRSQKARAVSMNYKKTVTCAILESGKPYCWNWTISQNHLLTWTIWGTTSE